MAYVLFRFGALDLPVFNTTFDLDVVAAKNTMVRTILNGYDSAGSAQADQNLPQTIRYKRTIVGEPVTNIAAWRDAVDALRAMSRKRAILVRQALDNTEEHYCTARFMSAVAPQDYKQPWNVYETTIQFLQFSPWVGHDHRTWHLDDGHFLDTALFLDDAGYTVTLNTSPKVTTVTNGGNRATNNIRLTFTVGSAAITALTVKCGSAEFTFNATVTAGGTLVIDSGAQSVLNSGVAAYANFALTSNHTIEDWLRFDPGDNTLTVTYTGGGSNSTFLIEFQDGWE
jgi:hypothetical protein